MPGPNTPTSHNLTAAASAVGSWACPVLATLITVTNEGTAGAWVTVDGSTPSVNGDNQYFIPAGGYEEIPVVEIPQSQGGSGTLTIKGISSAALSLWIEVDQ
jgi:hypothetical protein